MKETNHVNYVQEMNLETHFTTYWYEKTPKWKDMNQFLPLEKNRMGLIYSITDSIINYTNLYFNYS